MNENIDMTALQNIDPNTLDSMNMGADMAMYGDYANTMAAVNMGMNIFMLLAFIGMGYGLYTLAKKMNIKNAWMGWVPLLQYYTMTQVAGVSFRKYILNPILYIIGVAVVGAILMFIAADYSYILAPVLIIAYIVAYIYYIVKYIQVLSATSKRTGRGGWTTAGLFFIPFIMYPIVAYKFKGLKEENKKEEKVVEL